MILDTSALIAVLQQEEDAERFSTAMAGASALLMSAGSYVELFIVADARGIAPRAEALIKAADIGIAPVTEEHAELAREAHRRYGGGRYGLNFGDCFAYALHKATGEPLLFKGEDFPRTDVVSALPRS